MNLTELRARYPGAHELQLGADVNAYAEQHGLLGESWVALILASGEPTDVVECTISKTGEGANERITANMKKLWTAS